MTDTPDIPAPDQKPPSELPGPEPFLTAELQACLKRPQRTLDIILAERHRLVATVSTGTALGTLLVVLGACSVVAATPFAAVDGGRRLLHVATLFLGSVLVCFPALPCHPDYIPS